MKHIKEYEEGIESIINNLERVGHEGLIGFM
jgi:hypothetical protein